MMMGGWFAATAIGNYLVSVPGLLWMKIPLWATWTVLIAICVVSGIFMLINMKKIEQATK
jgi:POT family proton-dependent oligopeptide transporter